MKLEGFTWRVRRFYKIILSLACRQRGGCTGSSVLDDHGLFFSFYLLTGVFKLFVQTTMTAKISSLYRRQITIFVNFSHTESRIPFSRNSLQWLNSLFKLVDCLYIVNQTNINFLRNAIVIILWVLSVRCLQVGYVNVNSLKNTYFLKKYEKEINEDFWRDMKISKHL